MTKEIAYTAGPVNVRCHAHKKNGERCRRWSLRGSTVCTSHGAAAPAVRRRAAERIEASLDRAALAVVRLMEDAKTPHAVKLAAAKDLLDRGGLSAKQIVEVNNLAPWQVILQKIIVPAVPEAPVEAVVVTPEYAAHIVNSDDTPPRRIDPDGVARRRSNQTRIRT